MSPFSVFMLLFNLCHLACVESRAAVGLEQQLQTHVGSGSVENIEEDINEILEESSRQQTSDESLGR